MHTPRGITLLYKEMHNEKLIRYILICGAGISIVFVLLLIAMNFPREREVSPAFAWFFLFGVALFLLFLAALFLLSKIEKIAHKLQLQRKELERSNERYRVVVEKAVDGIIIINSKGIIESFNPACEIIFGYSADEVVGHNVHILMDEPHKSAHDGYLKRYLSTATTKVVGVNREVTARRKNGICFPMELSLGAFAVDGEVFFCGMVRDITTRKEHESIRANLSAIVLHSDDAIVSLLLDGTITSWNKGAERLLGYLESEIQHKPISLIIPPYLQEQERALIEQIHEGGAFSQYETVRLHRSGTAIDVILTASPLISEEGHVVGVSMIFRDYREQKASYQKISHYLKELEQSNHRLDEFAHIVSHDLKEPIRGIHHQATLLIEHAAQDISVRMREKLDRIVFLAERAGKQIDGLLHYAKLGYSEEKGALVSISAVVYEVRGIVLAGSHTPCSITIESPLPEISCNEAVVRELFLNLIINGVKYNESVEKVITIGSVSSTSSRLPPLFYVKDNGIGIDPSQHQEIFRMFRRLQISSDFGGGTGTGLAYVKRIIDLHGGAIWVTSSPGLGSTFYFTLERGDIEPTEYKDLTVSNLGTRIVS